MYFDSNKAMTAIGLGNIYCTFQPFKNEYTNTQVVVYKLYSLIFKKKKAMYLKSSGRTFNSTQNFKIIYIITPDHISGLVIRVGVL